MYRFDVGCSVAAIAHILIQCIEWLYAHTACQSCQADPQSFLAGYVVLLTLKCSALGLHFFDIVQNSRHKSDVQHTLQNDITQT